MHVFTTIENMYVNNKKKNHKVIKINYKIHIRAQILIQVSEKCFINNFNKYI